MSLAPEVLNFYAGPTALPGPVVERIRRDLSSFRGTGMGVMEISHRAPQIEDLLADTAARARFLLGLGGDFEVLLVQGGGSLQFSMIPMNFSAAGDLVDYVDTGYWAKKAIAEARQMGRDVAVVASAADRDYSYVPAAGSIESRAGARYLHLVTNNTVEGTQFRELPQADSPLIADMSSDLMTGPFDAGPFDLVYAHAQKNIGIAGVTIVIIRKELLSGIEQQVPAILDYRTHARHGSNYHTPPVFAIYVTWLMLGWLAEEIGGLAAIGEINRRKAAALYDYLDETPFYRALADPASRSAMNVTFTLDPPELLAPFLAAADNAAIMGLAGHRSVGGCRASLFNGVSQDAVGKLIDFMHGFERERRGPRNLNQAPTPQQKEHVSA
jgi:phosphoserine aminotransferase